MIISILKESRGYHTSAAVKGRIMLQEILMAMARLIFLLVVLQVLKVNS
jgi:hypothetical protein